MYVNMRKEPKTYFHHIIHVKSQIKYKTKTNKQDFVPFANKNCKIKDTPCFRVYIKPSKRIKKKTFNSVQMQKQNRNGKNKTHDVVVHILVKQ